LHIDPDDLRRHYGSLSDETLIAIDRNDLIEMAQPIFDEELSRRRLSRGEVVRDSDGALFARAGLVDQGDWLDDAACACAFTIHAGVVNAPEAAAAREVLQAAGIPCEIAVREVERPSEDPPPLQEYCVMVPGGLNLHATSILDRDIFNAEHEANWRTHLEALSDQELRALDPEVFCAGLLDRVERMKSAWRDEIERRR
jgi:hypothetical protein